MTMIAFHVQDDGIDIVSDTLTYDPNGRSVGRSGKVQLLPHLNAAMLAQGAAGLEALWAFRLASFTEDLADFDGLDEVARHELPATWEQLNKVRPGSSDSIVFHLGYSPSEERYAAYAYPSIEGFRRCDVSDRLYAMPAPVSSDPQAPTSTEEWVDLAKRIRLERGLAPILSGLKVFVGGDVVHTRLEVGAITHRTVHSFDDTGAEFREMVAGTMHPLSQVGPCPCASGRRFADCHLMRAHEACNCRSGLAFGDCCSVVHQVPVGAV